MRVAYVCADAGVPVFGSKGCSVHVQEMIRAFVRRGDMVELFASRLGGAPPEDLRGVSVHTLPMAKESEASLRERVALAGNRRLRIELERAGPFDLVYERYSLWSHTAMEYAQALGIPGVLEVNAPLILEQTQHRRLVHRDEAERIADRTFAAASTMIAVSDEVAGYLNGRCGSSERVHTVSNGVNTERFSDCVSPAVPDMLAGFTVGFAGTLKPWHGVDVLIDSFAILQRKKSGVGLLIVGDGPQRESIEGKLADEGLIDLAQVQLTGAVDPALMPAMLTSMSVGVAPYPDLEGFYFSPIKIYEYMAAGLPVVASRIGGIPGLIKDGYNGLLCRPGDPMMLADALCRLYDDPTLRNRLGSNARRTVLSDHTWDAVVERILAAANVDAASRTAEGERVA